MLRCLCLLILGGAFNICLGCGRCPDRNPVDAAQAPADVNVMDTNEPVVAPPEPNRPLTSEKVLLATQKAADELQSLDAQLIYEYVQPLYESTTRRSGFVCYRREEQGRSDLRISFERKQEDEMPEVRYREDLYFDGIWRTHIDYQGRSVKKHQLAPAEKPMNAMDLVSQNVPVFGFNGLESLREQYDVTLFPQEIPSRPVHLRFVADPNAPSEEPYRRIDVWLSRDHWLPLRVEAEDQDENLSRWRFPGLKVNQPVAPEKFDIHIPDGFGTPEIVPLP